MMMAKLNDIFGLPVNTIRQGDTIYLVVTPRVDFKRNMMRLETQMMRWKKYRCPFDFETQYEKWIAWKVDEIGRKISTGELMSRSGLSVDEAKPFEIKEDMRFYTQARFGVFEPKPRHNIIGLMP